jgi:hypothetical protein
MALLRSVMLITAVGLYLFLLKTAWGQSAASDSLGWAYVKASPLPVLDTPASTKIRQQSFEFGEPYPITERAGDIVGLQLRDSTRVFLRRSYITETARPLYLITAAGFNLEDRPRIRMWESQVRLSQFLSSPNDASSQWDYEEYLDGAVPYELRLPILETDSVDLLGGQRPVKVASVLLPVSRDMNDALARGMAEAAKPLSLHFVIDISGSTNGFAETAVGELAKALARIEVFQQGIRSIDVTTFGATTVSRSAFLGAMSLTRLQDNPWHPGVMDQTTEGDSEPLIDGLAAMLANVPPEPDAKPVVLVLSGTDVQAFGFDPARKPISIENLRFDKASNMTVLFVQITPEPGTDLRRISERIRDVLKVRYIEFSKNITDEIIAELRLLAVKSKSSAIGPRALRSLASLAHKTKMLAFLPREPASQNGFHSRPPFAQNADWFSVRLWLPIDPLLWKETLR